MHHATGGRGRGGGGGDRVGRAAGRHLADTYTFSATLKLMEYTRARCINHHNLNCVSGTFNI